VDAAADPLEAMLAVYRRQAGTGAWQPPARADLTTPRGGFSGGPFGLAVRYVVHGEEVVWLEASRMGGCSLLRITAGRPGGPERLAAEQDAYLVGADAAETAANLAQMHDRNARFWAQVAEHGLDDALPRFAQVNAVLRTGEVPEPPAG
jgi:hypothetical protein